MRAIDVIRAWKDEDYRSGLSAVDLGAVPTNPAGAIELPDEELASAVGAATERLLTFGCCGRFTYPSETCECSRDTCKCATINCF